MFLKSAAEARLGAGPRPRQDSGDAPYCLLMRSAPSNVALASVCDPDACDFVERLPLDCLLAVFALLPLSRRLRCLEVSRLWRRTLSNPAFWMHCNLSGDGGAGGPLSLRRCEARLGLALRFSQGGVRSLNLTGLRGLPFRTVHRALCACGGELREARITHTLDFFTAGQVQQLLNAGARRARRVPDQLQRRSGGR